jgi:hypothetical protein
MLAMSKTVSVHLIECITFMHDETFWGIIGFNLRFFDLGVILRYSAKMDFSDNVCCVQKYQI